MNTPAQFRSGGLLSSSLVLCALILQVGLQQSHAQITLANLNSVAKVDPTSQAGMFSWAVQGQNQLAQQWFWYRIGNTAEQSINTIGAPVVSLFNGTRGLSTVYTSPGQFSIQVDYLLTGGANVGVGQVGVSDMAETITINNLSANPLDFHFFQYSDFDLGGPGNDMVQLGTNLFGKFNEAVQSEAGVALTETVTAPGADHGEAALFNTTLAKLNNGVADNLSDSTGPIGPGDATWALQWDFLGMTGSKIISKDKNLQVTIVPEPSTLSLIAVGLVGSVLCAWRRRQSA